MSVPVSFISYRTFLKDCPFVIKVRATRDGQKLYVKEISGEHNHELSEVKIIVDVTNMVIYYRNFNSCRKYFVTCQNKGVLILKKNKKQ